MPGIILASKSPRRSELLKKVGLKFDIYVDDVPEVADKTLPPQEFVSFLARQKAMNAASRFSGKDVVIISADTVVSLNGKILGKPLNEEDAYNMLSALSGQEHEVYTGFAVHGVLDGRTFIKYEKTAVKFKPLSESEIRGYISTGEPMDKAGAYGIQNYGAMFVEGIRGDYFSVVGLPLCKLTKVLKDKFDINIL